MKGYTNEEKQRHLENWRNGGLSKTAYAKSMGIHPTTFCTWVKSKDGKKAGFIEINRKNIHIGNNKNIVIKKDGFTIGIPQYNDIKDMRIIFEALGLLK